MNGVASETLVGEVFSGDESSYAGLLEDVENVDVQIDEVADLIALFLTIA